MDLSKLGNYNKFWIALAGAVATVVVQFYGKNQVVQAVVPLLMALGVYATPNKA